MSWMTNSVLIRNPYLVHVFGRPRLLLCLLIGILTYLVSPVTWHGSTRILIAWNLATWLYIVLAWHMMAKATEESIRRHAIQIDESRFVVLTLSIIAAVACLAAIFAQLAAVKSAQGDLRFLHLGLAAVTIVSAWTFIHLIFAQHYAHEYFVEREEERQLPEEMRGGLLFPGCSQPSYADFIYFSFVIGCASQTADVETTSTTMRTVSLIHGVIAFFFNTTVLALTINIGSGLVS
jgi:uncharacterized membrane protein